LVIVSSEYVIDCKILVNKNNLSARTSGLIGGGLYRFSDPQDKTSLYRGQTESWAQRLPNHPKKKEIFKDYDGKELILELIKLSDKEKRIRVEAMLIEKEKPVVNVDHNPARRRRINGYRFQPSLFAEIA